MPSRNILKNYCADGFYHVYNRGVEKRKIFIDDSDYKYFLCLLKLYLTSSTGSHPVQGKTLKKQKTMPDFSSEIDLFCYCLMPNHYHLLISQSHIDSMPRFMKSLGTNYSMYFNHKYERVGSLFQGAYKAVQIKEDSYLLHLSRYIHLNPTLETGSHPAQGETLSDVRWTSYDDYLGKRKSVWLKRDYVLDVLSPGKVNTEEKMKQYKEFLEGYQDYQGFLPKNFIIED